MWLFGTVLGILFSLSGREILASTKMSLERRVEESLEEIEMQDGELKIDSDFYSVENGVYLSMYDSTGYFLYGKIPGGFDRQPDFLDGEVREIKDKAGEEDWYIYDLFFRPGEGKEIYVTRSDICDGIGGEFSDDTSHRVYSSSAACRSDSVRRISLHKKNA